MKTTILLMIGMVIVPMAALGDTQVYHIGVVVPAIIGVNVPGPEQILNNPNFKQDTQITESRQLRGQQFVKVQTMVVK